MNGLPGFGECPVCETFGTITDGHGVCRRCEGSNCRCCDGARSKCFAEGRVVEHTSTAGESAALKAYQERRAPASAFLVRVYTTDEKVLLQQPYGTDENSARHDAAFLNARDIIPGKEPLKRYWHGGDDTKLPAVAPRVDYFFLYAEVVELVPGLVDA